MDEGAACPDAPGPKAQLSKLWKDKSLQEFAWSVYRKGHGPTKHGHWLHAQVRRPPRVCNTGMPYIISALTSTRLPLWPSGGMDRVGWGNIIVGPQDTYCRCGLREQQQVLDVGAPVLLWVDVVVRSGDMRHSACTSQIPVSRSRKWEPLSTRHCAVKWDGPLALARTVTPGYRWPPHTLTLQRTGDVFDNCLLVYTRCMPCSDAQEPYQVRFREGYEPWGVLARCGACACHCWVRDASGANAGDRQGGNCKEPRRQRSYARNGVWRLRERRRQRRALRFSPSILC